MGKEIIITDVKFKRIILMIDGEINGFDDALKMGIAFISEDREEIVFPQYYEIKNGKFHLLINMLGANDQYPLTSGYYFLTFYNRPGNSGKSEADDRLYIKQEKTAKEYRVCVSEQIEKGINHKIENEMNLIIEKSNINYFKAFSAYDLDTKEYFIEVDYYVKPTISILKRIYIYLKNKIISFYKKLYRKIFKILSTKIRKKGNVIFFTSGSRSVIGGNEKYIYDRMLERGLDKQFKFRFHFKANIKEKQNVFKFMKFVYYLATSDIIIVDDYYPILYEVDYPKDVKVIQVWHACGAFKAVGMERIVKPGGPAFDTRVHKCYTHVPVSSEHSGFHCAESFCIDYSKCYPTGIPRTDVFFDDNYAREIKKRLNDELIKVPEGKKVYLYAPTFRGRDARTAYFPFDKIDLYRWGEFCEENNALLIIKMHPFVTEKINIPEKYKQYIYDATAYREINDILFISDVLITDYSSVIYEFSLLRKPMLFYAFDLKMYEATRDFYEPFVDIVPGKIVKRFEELIQAMEKEDYDFGKMDGFLKKNFKYMDGKSTDRVIDTMILDND